jgi:RNA-directed DNA polymerase
LTDIVAELRDTLLGWEAYFGSAEVLSPLRDIDKWIRRKLRCYHWKQWGRAGYRELRRRGVSVREAWNTSKSAHGPWRLSNTPALALALPVLQQFGAAKFGGEVGVQFIEPPCTRSHGGVGVAPCKRMEFSCLRWQPRQSLARSRVPSLA